jgi:hypothetical protein
VAFGAAFVILPHVRDRQRGNGDSVLGHAPSDVGPVAAGPPRIGHRA